MINSDGLLDYEMTPPILYLPTSNTKPMSKTPNSTDELKREEEGVLDEDKDQPDR